ncbi:rhomboid family intramembrane serine protease [Campylobacter sp. MIT 12-8780]|uniref:rhomboid family intramembrane serine protease n=1 Tax=unclassified Campylobacter TaxID=2593542 RepID=UPI0010F899A9|nr:MULTISPECIES: rhomboid family intramembrane serine protease [unclassified Campylobacter]TKX29051.1 rhomboid family intramembrane serine protease [Campylobacter sp. MIT 12-5580]TQR41869.1 rhomboid family intramembrane serine protease [Campylobacter sp. MIT 12-8780]
MFCVLLIALNIIIYFLLPDNELKVIFGLNLAFKDGFYWQLLSSMFLHANLTHLALNMITLYQFGFVLERYLGSLRFALLYILGGLACSFLSFLYIDIFETHFVNIVGASGAICVLIGYYACIDKSSAKGLVVAILLISFAPLLVGVNIAWYAHIFGFLCGFIIAKMRILKK